MAYPNTKEAKILEEKLGVDKLEEAHYFPRYFEIETVNACNARCSFCTINDWQKRDDVIMSMELFQKFVDEVSDYSNWIRQICLNRDGEPTLDRDLAKRVKLLKNIGIKKVTFATNASKLNNKLSRELIEAGLDDIMFSIDGTTKDVFEKIRIRLDFDQVKENVLNFIKLRNEINPNLSIRVRMVVTPENKHQVKEFILFWTQELSANDEVYAMKLHTWGNQLTNESKSNIAFYQNKPCISPFSTVVIQVDGIIPLCSNDYNAKFQLGDFRKCSIKEIWQGSEYMHLRQSHMNARRNNYKLCKGCDFWERPIVGKRNNGDKIPKEEVDEEFL